MGLIAPNDKVNAEALRRYVDLLRDLGANFIGPKVDFIESQKDDGQKEFELLHSMRLPRAFFLSLKNSLRFKPISL
jgi:hypothetical protein